MKTTNTVKEIEILISSGIELTEGAFSINGEIETRLNTRRKINRSISNVMEGARNYDVFELPLPILIHMKEENEDYINRLQNLKKDHSPFKNVVPMVCNEYETGAILHDSWGWEQTNVDFYCIVKRTEQTVTILPMKQKRSEEIGFMTNEETPTEIDFSSDPISKKVKSRDGKEIGFTLRNYSGGGWVSLWDGSPKTSTHYA